MKKWLWIDFVLLVITIGVFLSLVLVKLYWAR